MTPPAEPARAPGRPERVAGVPPPRIVSTAMERPVPRRPARLALALVVALPAAVAPLAAGCASVDPEEAAASGVLQAGIRQAEAGDVDGAIRTLSNGVQQEPSNIIMRFELARLQYEVGEASHLKERRALRAAATFGEQGRRDEAQANRREANEHRARATPYYTAARDNLRVVCDTEPDHRRIAWAFFLLMRCDLFFEDWEEALEHIQRAIQHGRPTGPLLTQWRDFETGLKDRVSAQQRGSGD